MSEECRYVHTDTHTVFLYILKSANKSVRVTQPEHKAHSVKR